MIPATGSARTRSSGRRRAAAVAAPARSTARTAARARLRSRIAVVVAGLVLALGLVPMFQANVLAPGDTFFFTQWDRESQALVLGGIEQDVTGGRSRWGLQNAVPNVLSPYDTFDGLGAGARPSAVRYAPYPSSLGMQGRLFDVVYHAGCSSLNCLNTVESGLFSLVFVGFAALLALVVRRSLGLVVLLSGLVSPWVVSAAHNLYWVPWTWLLPAMAACLVVAARSSRSRATAFVLAGVATAVKASTGYEFLTSTTLLAASIPVLAALLGCPQPWRRVLRDAGIVFGACVAGFLVVLGIHALVAGDGSVGAGFAQILHDAMKRTYGSPSLAGDAVTSESLRVSPLAVLATYLVDWRTSVFSVGIGGPFTSLALGPGGFWVLVLVAGAITGSDLVAQRPRGRRNLALLVAAAAPPISWFVIAKSHSYTATSVNFVLWYLVLIPVLVWIIADAVATSRPAVALRRLVRSVPEPG